MGISGRTAERSVDDTERWVMGVATEARGNDRRSALLLSGDARVWLFSAGLVILAVQLYLHFLAGKPTLDRPFTLAWWTLAIFFAVAEVCVVHIHLRRQVLSASLSEIPLVLGLYFAEPGELMIAYVLGAGVALVIHRRQPPTKLFFNLCHLSLQACVASILFYGILAGHDPVNVRGWFAALGAMVLTDAGAGLVIAVAMSLADGRMLLVPRLIGVGTVATFANAALGLSLATTLWVRMGAGWLLVFPAVLLLFAYRAYAHQRHKHESLERLYESTRRLQRALGRESMVDSLLDQARTMLRAEMAELIVFTPDASGEAQRTILESEGAVTTESIRLDATEGVWARVASEGRTLLLVRPIRNERVQTYFDARGIKDAIVAPIRDEEAIVGTLLVANRTADVGTFDDGDVKMLETLAAHASMSLEKGRLLDSLRDQAEANEYLAKHDPLTELHNRSHFLDQVRDSIGRAKRTDDLVAVLLMDLDRFKEINDTLGHQVGDRVLVELSERLRTVLPGSATLARVGGDEFAILLPRIDDVARSTEQAQKVTDLLREPIHLADATLDVQASIGVSLYPIHARDADGLLQRADVAMYLAKGSHSSFELYGVERDMYSASRLSLVSELRQAIEQEELVVFYQPKISLRTGEVEGVEALVRWDHPRKGLIPPNEFIPLAEHTGLIKPLTTFVIRRSVQEVRKWRRMEPNIHVAVNLSVRSLVDANICEQIAEILDENDAPRGSLELEITESSIMDDPVRAIGVLTKLSTMGITLAIDDFGTGYSSLSYLKRLPVDNLKIDKSFVLGMESDENDAIIVRSIIDLGKNLGMKVVAEGVESSGVSATLKSMGCDIAQGFGISRPLPAEKLGPWLMAHAAVRASATDRPVADFPAAANN